MAQLPCDICGKRGHPWFDCPQRATKPTGWKPERLTKSTAARKDVQGITGGIAADSGTTRHTPERLPPAAGTQAPPVDTKPRSPKRRPPLDAKVPGAAEPPSLHSAAPPVIKTPAEAAAAVAKRTRGRPKLHPDRKAYKAQKERQRRAAKKGKP